MAEEEFYQDTIDRTPYFMLYWLFFGSLIIFLLASWGLWSLGSYLKHNRYNDVSTWWDRVRGVKVDTTNIHNQANEIKDSATNQVLDAANQAAKDVANQAVETVKQNIVDEASKSIENIDLNVEN